MLKIAIDFFIVIILKVNPALVFCDRILTPKLDTPFCEKKGLKEIWMYFDVQINPFNLYFCKGKWDGMHFLCNLGHLIET